MRTYQILKDFAIIMDFDGEGKFPLATIYVMNRILTIQQLMLSYIGSGLCSISPRTLHQNALILNSVKMIRVCFRVPVKDEVDLDGKPKWAFKAALVRLDSITTQNV